MRSKNLLNDYVTLIGGKKNGPSGLSYHGGIIKSEDLGLVY